MAAPDLIGLIEDSYRPRSSTKAWLSAMAPKVVGALSSDWLAGLAYLYDERGEHEAIAFGRGGVELDAALALTLTTSARATRSSAQSRWYARVMRSPGVSTLSEVGLPEGITEASPWPISDAVGLRVPTGDGRMATFAAATPEPHQLQAAEKHLWLRVAIHLSAGCRLVGRRQSTDATDVEAVLEPGARVLHATGKAKSPAVREQLRRAVQNVERARTQAGRTDRVAALELWQGLLAGRWSLVDHFDTDGKRYLLARRNDPGMAEPAGLSRRQRQVAFYASLGWSNKDIGYALGLAPNTVSFHVGKCLDRLGIRSRAELVRLVSALTSHPRVA